MLVFSKRIVCENKKGMRFDIKDDLTRYYL